MQRHGRRCITAAQTSPRFPANPSPRAIKPHGRDLHALAALPLSTPAAASIRRGKEERGREPEDEEEPEERCWRNGTDGDDQAGRAAPHRRRAEQGGGHGGAATGSYAADDTVPHRAAPSQRRLGLSQPRRLPASFARPRAQR
jgi:hypothetical protein